MTQKIKAMIVSVGGTAAPVIHSLNSSKPEYVCFFISRQTRKMMEEEILPKLDPKPQAHDWIVTSNPELLSECYLELITKLPNVLEKWEVDPKEVCVDYTGGTKTMSAALVLATVEDSCCYSYVGGDERSKGGIGIVLNGKEKMRFLDNPWDSIALKEKREVSFLFNKARYASAAEVLGKCIERVSKDQQPYFKALREMVVGYDLWDRFRHREAKDRLYRSRDVLLTYAHGSAKREAKGLAVRLQDNLQFLEKLLSGGKPSKLFFHDLLANAKRRADIEKKFDDGVARLYRAMELSAQAELKEPFGIDTSRVRPESVPERLQQEFLTKYGASDDRTMKIPLFASYQLLNELGSELAKNFFNVYEEEIKSLLDIRNSSILAHGLNPVEEKTFQRLFNSTMKFSGTRDEDLPEFPILMI